jgi:hypothetical protein
MVIALMHASNYFSPTVFNGLKRFVGDILNTRKSSDKNFIAIVLIQGLLELKGENVDVKDRVTK